MSFAIGELIIYLLIALLLGLLVGYLLWYRRWRSGVDDSVKTHNDLAMLRIELEEEQAHTRSLQADFDEKSTTLTELETNHDSMTRERDDLNVELSDARVINEDLESRGIRLEADAQIMSATISEREVSLAELNASAATTTDELDAAKGRLTGLEADVDTERERATTLSAQLTAITTEHSERAIQIQSLSGDVDTERAARAIAATELDSERANIAKLASDLTEARSDMAAAQDANTALARELGEARSDMAAAQDANTALARELGEARSATKECTAARADLTDQLAKARDAAVQAQVDPPEAGLVDDSPDGVAVAAAVAAGTASFLGPEPVEELRSNPDELQRVKGVGPYLEQLLNRNGIYTFRQIARLSPVGVRDLDTQLESFKGRIGRDNWLTQAGELHTEKYGS